MAGAINASNDVHEWFDNLHTVHKPSPDATGYDQRFTDNYTHEKMWRYLISPSKQVKPADSRMNAPQASCEHK